MLVRFTSFYDTCVGLGKREGLNVGVSDFFFGTSFYHDGFSYSARLFILFVLLIFMVLLRFEIQNDTKLRRVEFIFLFLTGGAFSMLMIASSNLLTLFLSIEGLVMVMYVLTAGSAVHSGVSFFKILRFRSIEGSLKYLITNAVASGFFLLGSAILFFCLRGGICRF
jgi:NADH:ubiquinone oxidoreductase subunit 2 (subunit N)